MEPSRRAKASKMKLKITRPDGTILDIEGTDEECMKALQFQPPLHVCPPCTHVCPIYVYPNYPTQTWPNILSPHITWTLNPNISTGGGLSASTLTNIPPNGNGTVFTYNASLN
jgi:hypothetical protein